MKKDEVQKLIDEVDDLAFGATVTFSISFVVPKGHTDMTPEDLFKEWFEKFHLTTRTYGHAFRDGSLIGNSEDNITYEIIKKTEK